MTLRARRKAFRAKVKAAREEARLARHAKRFARIALQKRASRQQACAAIIDKAMRAVRFHAGMHRYLSYSAATRIIKRLGL